MHNLTSLVHNPHLTVIFLFCLFTNQGIQCHLGKKQENYQKNEKQKMEESFGLDKKSYDPKTDTET